MTIIKTDVSKRVKTVAAAACYGAVMTEVFRHTFAAGATISANDIIEFAGIPANHRLVSGAIKFPVLTATGGSTMTVAVITGELGEDTLIDGVTDRTLSSSVLLPATAVTVAANSALRPDVHNVSVQEHSGVGIQFNQNVTIGASPVTVELQLNYTSV